jgi:hypothetical protein
VDYLPGLASNHDPPDLCLLSSWDFRQEPPVPGLKFIESLSREKPCAESSDCKKNESHPCPKNI